MEAAQQGDPMVRSRVRCGSGSRPSRWALPVAAAALLMGAASALAAPSAGEPAGFGWGGRPMGQRSADAHFIVRMIPHHEEAIAMADLALERSRRPEIRAQAERIRTSQSEEIDRRRRRNVPGLLPPVGGGSRGGLEAVCCVAPPRVGERRPRQPRQSGQDRFVPPAMARPRNTLPPHRPHPLALALAAVSLTALLTGCGGEQGRDRQEGPGDRETPSYGAPQADDDQDRRENRERSESREDQEDDDEDD
jgi:hypothetical protein